MFFNKRECIINVKNIFEFIDFLASNKNAVHCKGGTEKKKQKNNENVATRSQTTTIDKNIQGKYMSNILLKMCLILLQ